MEATKILSSLKHCAQEYAPLKALSEESTWVQKENALVFPLNALEDRVSLTLSPRKSSWELTAEGHDDEIRRLLRNCLVGKSTLRSRPSEHHLLKRFGKSPDAEAMVSAVLSWCPELQETLQVTVSVSAGESEPPESSVLGYWWDSRANFGDAAGPWLIRAMTGKHVINTRFTQAKGRAVGSIGSLFQMLNRGRLDMWGSGILYPPSEGQTRKLNRLKSVTVHAVRGPKTRAVLQDQLGWEAPEIYGDPALLFPRYFQPRKARKEERIAFVPHKHHRKYFKRGVSPRVTKLAVADDVETVVSSIASAGVCISTSLHGIIFAQAYGVPWVWLNVHDDELKGGEFKFEDFFATVDSQAVSRYDVSVEGLKDLDLESVASTATLPELRTDLDQLERAFPLPRSG